MSQRYGNAKSRRLPDTFNSEVTRAKPQRRGIVNLSQFEFLADVEVRPGGEAKQRARVEALGGEHRG